MIQDTVRPNLYLLPCLALSHQLNDSPCLVHVANFHYQHLCLFISSDGNNARVEGITHRLVTAACQRRNKCYFRFVIPDRAGSCAIVVVRRDVWGIGNNYIIFPLFPRAIFRTDIAMQEIDMGRGGCRKAAFADIVNQVAPSQLHGRLGYVDS